MWSLFRKDKVENEIVLIVDVENGSVGAALAYIPVKDQSGTAQDKPVFLAGSRVHLPVPQRLSGATLLVEIKDALYIALQNIRETTYPARAVVFFSPPWSTLRQGKHGLEWDHNDDVISAVSAAVSESFDTIPISFQALGTAASSVVGDLFPDKQGMLLCTVTGEVTELIPVHDSVPYGRVTIPIGTNTLLRTLRAHTDMSDAEVRSSLRLMQHESSPIHSALAEPLAATSAHFVKQYIDAVFDLAPHYLPSDVLVIAQEPSAMWFARMLAQSDNAAFPNLFPQGGTVRPLRNSRLAQHVISRSPTADAIMMLETAAL